jgi:hypothetical protein
MVFGIATLLVALMTVGITPALGKTMTDTAAIPVVRES